MKDSRNDSVLAAIEKKSIPTYMPKAAMKLPIFYEKRQYQGASGKIYPLAATDSFSDVKEDKLWEVATLENEYIYVEILPEIGGKIKRAYDKKHNYDFVYHNEIIKPAGIGIAGPWISGGIEFNWPQHHRPTTFMPVEAVIEEHEDGSKTIWVGETEPLYKTKGMAGITVTPGRTYLKMHAKMYNDTALTQPFMWWSNLAAPGVKGYRIVFPEDVEYVFDHDRKAVMSWPIAKGRYGTEKRGYDFGEGCDLSHYSNIIPQSSYMVPFGESKNDYISGYDEGRNLGIVSVADHFVAPAKKLFTWGVSDFGDMWSMNLTDDNGAYIEIMTGGFTDNQPDFSWIAPYETKEFFQYWYPIFDIGLVKNATKDAAINLEERDGKLFLGINATGTFTNCSIYVMSDKTAIFLDKVTLTPDSAYIKSIEGKYEIDKLYAVVRDENGRILVDYKVFKRGDKKRPEPRVAAKKPEEIETVDELFINGLHLIQYRHHTFVPEDYFMEGLKRDPYDIRCNLEMGKLKLYKGLFEESLGFFDKALVRLTSRNETPYDTEVYYYRGLVLSYLGKKDEAYDSLYKCVWQYSYRSSGYFSLAVIDSSRHDFYKALQELDLSLETNTNNSKALILKSRLLVMIGKNTEAKEILEKLLKNDLLSVHAKCEMYLLGINKEYEDELKVLFKTKPDYAIGIASFLIDTGFRDDATKVLLFAKDNPLALYYLAYTTTEYMMISEYIDLAEKADYSYCFPSRLSDIAVLNYAMCNDLQSHMASYYLGCLYFHYERYDESILLFERSRRICSTFAPTLRNLALLYFNKQNNFKEAKTLLEEALRLDNDPRIFYEYQQLLKNTGCSVSERLLVYEKYSNCSDTRDDSYIEKLTLFAMTGEYQKVIDLAKKRQFHVYEGGEGKLSRLYCWSNILEGNLYLKKEEYPKALEYYTNALDIPKNFAEARSVFEDISYIYYHMARAYELTGNITKAKKYYSLGAKDMGVISETSYWQALSLMKTGLGFLGTEKLHAMIKEAGGILLKKSEYPYFGGGSPTPQPFEDDISKRNTISALLLQIYANYGLGHYEKVKKYLSKLEKLDRINLSLYIFKQIAEENIL